MNSPFLQSQNPYFRAYLGKYLCQKRLGLKYDVDFVAQSLQIPSTQYKKIEAGKVKIDSKIYEKIFDLLDLDHSEVLEITQIALIANANEISQELSENYPK